MASTTINLFQPVEPQVESVTLTLDLDEAFYVLASIAVGNGFVHGVNDKQKSMSYENEVYASLVHALRPAVPDFTARLEKHKQIERALRNNSYNFEDAAKMSRQLGVIAP